ncbi:MAG: hypothetical protein ISS66_21150 [Desulfobacteraceae bacterium]|nr:hypothetical protein [Desulfobacteraceae bacterium]
MVSLSERTFSQKEPEKFGLLKRFLEPILFDYAVDAISGTKVINTGLALRCVSEGANFRQIKGTRRLTMIR